MFLPIGLDSPYATAMFPTFVLAGLAFALAYGPLNIAATNGIAPEEQGLAGGLVQHVVPVRRRARARHRHRRERRRRRATAARRRHLLDGFHAAFVVPLIVAILGIVATAIHVRRPAPATVEPERVLVDISD